MSNDSILIEGCYNGRSMGTFYYNSMKFDKSTETTRTRVEYLKNFVAYLDEQGYSGIDKIEDLATFYEGNIRFLEDKIIDFILFLQKKKKLSYASQSGHLSTILLAYEMNRVVLPKKLMRKSLSENTNKTRSRGYYHEELKKLFDNSELRFRALIALLASSGIRIGAIYDKAENGEGGHNFLRVGDLKPATTNDSDTGYEPFTDEQMDHFRHTVPNYEDTYKIIVYRGTKYEYQAFCSPEAYRLTNEMLQARRDAWEKITDDSPLFRNEYNAEPIRRYFPTEEARRESEKARIRKIQNPEPLKHSAIEMYIRKRRIKLGIVKHTPVAQSDYGKIRTEVPDLHGFRKFAATQMDRAGVNDTVNEYLQGRKAAGQRSIYRIWPADARLIEYWKSVPYLTIDQTQNLQAKIDEKDEKIEDLEVERNNDMARIMEENADLKKEMAELKVSFKQYTESKK